jgi:hypothetical protein
MHPFHHYIMDSRLDPASHSHHRAAFIVAYCHAPNYYGFHHVVFVVLLPREFRTHGHIAPFSTCLLTKVQLGSGNQVGGRRHASGGFNLCCREGSVEFARLELLIRCSLPQGSLSGMRFCSPLPPYFTEKTQQLAIRCIGEPLEVYGYLMTRIFY